MSVFNTDVALPDGKVMRRKSDRFLGVSNFDRLINKTTYHMGGFELLLQLIPDVFFANGHPFTVKKPS